MERMNSFQVFRDSSRHFLYFVILSQLLITMKMLKEYFKIMIDFSINIIVIRYLNGWINMNYNLRHFPLYMNLLEFILKNNP